MKTPFTEKISKRGFWKKKRSEKEKYSLKPQCFQGFSKKEEKNLKKIKKVLAKT